MLPGPGCPACPSFPRLGAAETDARAQEILAPRYPFWQEAHHACRELLQLQLLKRRAEGELEFPCLRVAYAGETSPVASALADQGILPSSRVGLSKTKK
jgi:hypothetical protein